MRTHMRSIISVFVPLFLCSCGGVSIEVPSISNESSSPQLKMASGSSSAYTGAALSSQPVFGFYNGSSVDSSISDSIQLSAYLDSNCSMTVADGTMSVSQNPVALSSGLASFSGLSYVPPAHTEETIYLKALALQSGVSLCTSGIAVFQHFNAGSGYVKSGTSGVAGASGASENDYGMAVAVDSSGRIIVAGGSANTSGGTQLVLWRYFADGSPDNSFGGGSANSVTFGATGAAGATGGTEWDQPSFILIDSQGRYVVGGFSYTSSSQFNIAIWRYNPNGTLDTTFGAPNGYIVSPVTGASGFPADEFLYGGAIDSQGRIVATGSSHVNFGGFGFTFVVWRYNSDGTPDTNFGTNGHALESGYATHGAAGCP